MEFLQEGSPLHARDEHFVWILGLSPQPFPSTPPSTDHSPDSKLYLHPRVLPSPLAAPTPCRTTGLLFLAEEGIFGKQPQSLLGRCKAPALSFHHSPCGGVGGRCCLRKRSKPDPSQAGFIFLPYKRGGHTRQCRDTAWPACISSHWVEEQNKRNWGVTILAMHPRRKSQE